MRSHLPLPSEWTSVRISPGEDALGQDVLAVRVLVTSDDSSSEAESDCGGEASSAEPCEARPRRAEAPPLPEPLSPHLSLREEVSPQGPEESKVHALQQAHSFQSPTPSKYQNWRRKFQSNVMPVSNKRTMLPPKESSPSLSTSSLSSSPSPPSSSSASILGDASDCSTPPQVRAYNHPSQVSRGCFSPSTPIFLRRARAQGASEEVSLHLPHRQILERAEYYPARPDEEGPPCPRPPSPGEVASAGPKEAEAPFGDTRSIHQGPHSRCSPDQELSPGAGEDTGRGDGGSEQEEGKKSGLKKLILTQEQKTKLLDWNDSIPKSLHLEAREQLAENGVGGCARKPVRPLMLPQGARETLPAQTEAQEKTGSPVHQAPGEQSVPPPKSPLRLIANAIRRSLLPNTEGGKKAWTKIESKTLPASQPHACARSFSLRKTSFSKDWGQQARDMVSRSSVFFSPGFPAARAAQNSDPSPPDPALCTHSLPNQPSKIFPALVSPHCSKIEDVPTLLEKVSLQETLPDASRVPKRRFSLFSSLRHKDKSFESFIQEPRQRKDLRDLFSSPREKVLPVDKAQPLEKLLQPLNGPSLGQAVPPPTSVADQSPKHIPVQAQVTEAASLASSTTSSSADEEFDPQPSLRSKERKTLKRRRKLEKTTKQLAKQEELKRLYKAQAIQRQLEEVEEWQRAYEIQGVRLEKALRGEADSGTQDEARLLQEWFKLVLEKNKLIRYESELQIKAQELELEDHQSRLEQKLREKMLKEESQKDENDLNEEQEMLTEKMQVIEQRNKLVESLEEQRVREKAEDQYLESVVFSRGCPLSRT